ncbi:MAG: hypothetical protein LBU22_06920 [Dysgonamonadaceae bacterium]|nr:hypothetical protein [Dysgonamonadaceae bacterium]
MNKLSDYLPLIIIIISVLFSLLKGKKKKEYGHETTLPGKTPGAFMPLVPNVPESKKRVYQASVSDKPVEKQVPEKVHKAHKKNQIQPLEDTFTEGVEAESNEPYLDISDMEEIKKAVVYNEIFNRKYC